MKAGHLGRAPAFANETDAKCKAHSLRLVILKRTTVKGGS